ncbi:MAG: thiamine-phosphate kinase [FCB group bacterium]|jgi:thiamine-monophosphate kinase|nr:thiamine-phosphate kinase [FCB group bacterium]
MMRIGDLGEFGLIERLARLLPSTPNVLEGIGDDCAAFRLGDRVLLVSTDLSIEEVHFRRTYSEPEDIGWKAAAVSLSDIAAMGGSPLFCLVGLACPADTEVAFVERIYQGMSTAASRFGATIIGGDTSRTDGPITLDVMVAGEARGGRFLRRKGARIGDLLAATGHLGLSAAGLHAIEHARSAPTLVQIHNHPSPRIPEGQWLAGTTVAHAMIDISDGLVQDAGHLAEANQLGVNLYPDRLPVYPPLGRYCDEYHLDPKEFILRGGEDYELLFALDSEESKRTLEEFHREFRTVVTVVGEFTDAWAGVRIDGQEPGQGGYDHFRQASAIRPRRSDLPPPLAEGLPDV